MHLIIPRINYVLGGGSKAKQRVASSGKLLPRERIGNLLDPGYDFCPCSSCVACSLSSVAETRDTALSFFLRKWIL